MRVKKTDFRAISRRSIQRDFISRENNSLNKVQQKENLPQVNEIRRIIFVGENSGYYAFRFYLIGKLVRIVEHISVSEFYCEFIHDNDRVALNIAAGWSDNKKKYLLDCIKFKE